MNSLKTASLIIWKNKLLIEQILLLQTCFKILISLCPPVLSYCIINFAHFQSIHYLERPRPLNPVNILLLTSFSEILLRYLGCQDGSLHSCCDLKYFVLLTGYLIFWVFHCNELNVDAPPLPFTCWSLNPQCGGIKVWSELRGDYISHEGREPSRMGLVPL